MYISNTFKVFNSSDDEWLMPLKQKEGYKEDYLYFKTCWKQLLQYNNKIYDCVYAYTCIYFCE